MILVSSDSPYSFDFLSPAVSFCYIAKNMDFRFVPSDTVCFDKLSHRDY